MGEILNLPLSSVRLIREEDGRMGLTALPLSTKTDNVNATGRLVVCAELKDKILCPLEAFKKFMLAHNLYWEGDKIGVQSLVKKRKGDFLFSPSPYFNVVYDTTKMVKFINKEADFPFPAFAANVGRTSTATASLLARDSNGNHLLQPLTLESNHGWKRGSEMLMRYMARHQQLQPGSFAKTMQTLRDFNTSNTKDE